ncbi:serine/threonine-protein kinase [Fibrobacteres bacterium R8-0-B4]
MVRVDSGTFTMGCTSEQGDDCDKDESPTHSVTLSSYYIGKYEVTHGLWKAVMDSLPSVYTGNNYPCGIGDNYPVHWANWDDIVNEFIPKLNRLTGKTYRLPTEAEWEYAARGGNKSRGYKYSGSNNIDSVAWYGAKVEDTSCETIKPIGTKSPNELGIYDMSGNVYN